MYSFIFWNSGEVSENKTLWIPLSVSVNVVPWLLRIFQGRLRRLVNLLKLAKKALEVKSETRSELHELLDRQKCKYIHCSKWYLQKFQPANRQRVDYLGLWTDKYRVACKWGEISASWVRLLTGIRKSLQRPLNFRIWSKPPSYLGYCLDHLIGTQEFSTFVKVLRLGMRPYRESVNYIHRSWQKNVTELERGKSILGGRIFWILLDCTFCDLVDLRFGRLKRKTINRFDLKREAI